MAKFSNVKKPAMFIPIFDYLQSIGNIDYTDDYLNDIHLLNPTKTHLVQGSIDEDIVKEINLLTPIKYEDIQDADGYIYIFVLGHNFSSTDCSPVIRIKDGNTWQMPNLHTGIVNFESQASPPTYNGFSIWKAKYNNIDQINGFEIRIAGHSNASGGYVKTGCVSICSKWNPPHNPDLSLKMTRDFDGVKTTTTKGGATISNASYTRGGTFWANNYAWELSGDDYDNSNINDMSNRSKQRTLGRRTWSMNFSYLQPSDLMPKFEGMDSYETEFTTGEADDNSGSILESKSFFARVLNRVQGSHIPFIFLPNDTDPNYNPDQWAIVRFNQKNFSISQKAPELYSMSMKLRESF